jgi:hypothetical protein
LQSYFSSPYHQLSLTGILYSELMISLHGACIVGNGLPKYHTFHGFYCNQFEIKDHNFSLLDF